MKQLLRLFLFLIVIGINAQEKDASDFFENFALARKVNNVLSFINISPTINLNDYTNPIIYALVTPIHERYFVISLENQLPTVDKKQCKCFQVKEGRYLVFFDRSDANFGETKDYKNNFRINSQNATKCDDLFKQLEKSKQPKIPVNVFAYSIFEESFVYLEDLGTFDAIQYLEIEYNLNKPFPFK